MSGIEIVAVVAIIFMGLPAVVLNAILGFRKQGIAKKQLELDAEQLKLEAERVGLERQKVRLLELQAENRLLDRKIEGIE